MEVAVGEQELGGIAALRRRLDAVHLRKQGLQLLVAGASDHVHHRRHLEHLTKL